MKKERKGVVFWDTGRNNGVWDKSGQSNDVMKLRYYEVVTG